MTSDGQNRLRGESATLGMADVTNVPPALVSAVRGQVTVTNRALGGMAGAEADPEYLKFAKFMKTNPPAFQGDFNPKEVEGWIEALEGTFSVLACTGLQKVTFATYMLEANAEAWWPMLKGRSGIPRHLLLGKCSRMHSRVSYAEERRFW